MDTDTFEIYQLSDPRDRSPKYIGYSKNARQRLKQHLTSKRGQVSIWCQELRKLGLQPTLTILDLVTDEQEARTLEKQWIAETGHQHLLFNHIHNYEAMRKWDEARSYDEWLRKRFAYLGSDANEAIRLVKLGHSRTGHASWEYNYEMVRSAIEIIRQLPGSNVPLDDIGIIRITLQSCGILNVDGSREK